MIKVAPSILSADFTILKEEIEKVEKAGADYLHVDIMDGMFVPNITFGQGMVSAIKKVATVPLDVHLMIEKPERYIEQFAKAGADIITVHEEATTHLNRTLQQIKDCGAKAAVSLNPHTPIENIENVLYMLDMVLIMTINPGFPGQKYIESTTEKITKLKKIIDEKGYDIDIEVDGGINGTTAKTVVKAGANILVAGSYIYGAEDTKKAIQTLKEADK